MRFVVGQVHECIDAARSLAAVAAIAGWRALQSAPSARLDWGRCLSGARQSTATPHSSCRLVGIGEFFLLAAEIAFVALSEPDAQLIVGSPHDMAGVPIAKRRPEPKLVRNRFCPNA
jgi:hypothetical protein